MELNPPSSPVERQLTDDKWEALENFMKMNPFVFRVLVYKTTTHQYWIVRKKKQLLRIHKKA
jgi:hypothetical protein